MEFALIMGIGTLVAILIVASLPKSGHVLFDESVFSGKPTSTPTGRRDAAETFTMGDLEYLEKLERHQKDPQHWPCPFPPDAPPKIESD